MSMKEITINRSALEVVRPDYRDTLARPLLEGHEPGVLHPSTTPKGVREIAARHGAIMALLLPDAAAGFRGGTVWMTGEGQRVRFVLKCDICEREMSVMEDVNAHNCTRGVSLRYCLTNGSFSVTVNGDRIEGLSRDEGRELFTAVQRERNLLDGLAVLVNDAKDPDEHAKWWNRRAELLQDTQTCPKCGGVGTVGGHSMECPKPPCQECHGAGELVISETRRERGADGGVLVEHKVEPAVMETITLELKYEGGEVTRKFDVKVPARPGPAFVTLGAVLAQHPELADIALHDGDMLTVDDGDKVIVEADSTFYYVHTALWLKEGEGAKRMRLKARNLANAIREVWKGDYPEPSLHIHNEEDEIVAESVCTGIRGIG